MSDLLATGPNYCIQTDWGKETTSLQTGYMEQLPIIRGLHVFDHNNLDQV